MTAEYKIYPMIDRKEDVGINVYYRLRMKTQGDVSKIPYLKDADEALTDIKIASEFEEKAARILLVVKETMVAEKVALYLEEHLAKKEKMETDTIASNLFLQKISLAQEVENSQEIESEWNDGAQLAVMDLDIKMEQNKDPGNLFLRILQKGGPSMEEAVLFTGIAGNEEVNDKVEAIKALRVGNTYIQVRNDQIDASWVTDLMMNSGYRLVYINNVSRNYYVSVCKDLMDEKGYVLEAGCSSEWLVNYVMRKRGSSFCEENIDWCIDYAIEQSRKRAEKKNVLRKEDFLFAGKVERAAKDEIEAMPGLVKPKEMLHEMLALCVEEARNSKLKGMHRNMIFAGNPGTAKTTVAMLTGRMLAECGVSNGSFVVATRADLIGEYVGKTAVKTANMFKQARGGVLFIDEAAFLLNSDAGGFVQECVKEIVRYMEVYPDVMVIMACYSSEVEKLLALDDGLASRISKVVPFEDYSNEVLIDIADYMFREKGYKWNKEISASLLVDYLSQVRNSKGFGNAREVRKIVEATIVKHAVAWMDSGENDEISKEEVEAAIEEYRVKTKERRVIGF